MKNFVSFMEEKFKRHNEFFKRNSPGDMLVFSNCWRAGSSNINFGEWRSSETPFNPLIELPNPMSEEFLYKHAFELGAETAREASLIAEFHYDNIQDDWCPAILFHPGAGYQAAMSSGGDLTFIEGTDRYGGTYTKDHVIKDLDQMEKAFNHDNRWIKYAMDFWKGVQSQDINGLTVTPRYNRTPLDLAWDLRGDQIFYDFYECPERFEVLLQLCAQSIIEIDKIFRYESDLLREGVGGAQGVAFTVPTMILNGDPIDIISEEQVRRFNNVSLEIVTSYSKATLLHHHSIGIEKAKVVSEVKGLTVQELYQDPNGPRIANEITDELIEASLKIPVYIEFPVSDAKDNLDALAERLALGRFIVHLFTESAEEAKFYVSKLRKFSSF
jgi:hypothetical protein